MTAPIVHWFDALPSTQDALHELAQGGATVGTTVVAREQTLGRGSRGRGWESPLGGLWMSVLCRPPGQLAMEVLSLRIALAVAAAVAQRAPGISLQLKWPNDLMLAGRKLGGILCEARWQGGALGWVAVGLGMNVANPIPEGVRETAIALASVAAAITPDLLAEPLARAITDTGERRGLLTAAELSGYRSRDWLLGKKLLTPGPGIADGLAEDGSLRIRGRDGAVAGFRSGTVTLAADAEPRRSPLTTGA
jgi:BirA family transcriptional regulator, biotin operon repressor / biotin---[acetyl-CoA-carboxylase] ligase